MSFMLPELQNLPKPPPTNREQRQGQPLKQLLHSKSTTSLLVVKKKPVFDVSDRIQKLLPDCLKTYIYKEFFEIEYYCTKFKNALALQASKHLDIKFIRPYIPLILAKIKILEYLFLNMREFRLTYTSHKIENSKGFKYMNNGDSFAQSILMYKYH